MVHPGGCAPVKYQVGCGLIWDLIYCGHTTTIDLTTGSSHTEQNFDDACNPAVGSDVKVLWNPNQPKMEELGLTSFQGFIVLGHELAHARRPVAGKWRMR